MSNGLVVMALILNPCSKPLGGSKNDSSFHPSETGKMSTRNFWGIPPQLPSSSKVNSLLKVALAMRKLIPSIKMGHNFFLRQRNSDNRVLQNCPPTHCWNPPKCSSTLVRMFASSNSLTKIENLNKRALRFMLDDYSSSYERILEKSG